MVNRRSTREKIRTLLTEKYNCNFELLQRKLDIVCITKKSAKWIVQISVTIPKNENKNFRSGLKSQNSYGGHHK